ncbi:MAG: hypothetical protein R2748_05525 [Bryobacterales bacterium]
MIRDASDLWDNEEGPPRERRMMRLPVDSRLKALLDRVAQAEGVPLAELVEKILMHSIDEPPSDPYRESTRLRLAAMAAEEGIIRLK